MLSCLAMQKILKRTLDYGIKPLSLRSGEKLGIRELQILRLAAIGLSNKRIAVEMNLSLRTIKGYLVDIFAKLNVNSRTEAVTTALRAGLLSLDDLEENGSDNGL